MRRRMKFAAAVVGLVGLGATAGFASNTFTDVPAGRYYTDAVDWAFNNGVTTGTSATTFSPEQAVTRAQNVTFAYRYDQNIVQPALDGIDGRLDGLTGDVDGLFAGLDGLTGDVDGLSAGLDGLTGDVDGLSAGLDGLTAGLGVLTGDVVALDTLDELSCSATEVVINDDGWRCATPALTRSYGLVVGVGSRTLASAGSVGEYSSVAIGADGNPVISYQNESNDALELYVCTDSSCATGTNRTLIPGQWKGFYTSVAIGADGNPVVSHYDANTDDLELYVCGDPICTGGTTQVLVAGDDAGRYSSVAIGVDGNPVISHQRSASGSDLNLYVCFDPVCASGSNRHLVAGNAGYWTSVAIGADGNPVVSHYDDTSGDLELYVCGDPTCTTGTNRELVTADFVGLFTSVAIGADGNPVISHQHQKPNAGDLELYVCADPTCTTGTNRELVTGDVGHHTSVAIGDNGNPFISHQDGGNNDLELYVCANPTCTSGTNQTLETDNAGWWTSIAINNDGVPVISHHNSSTEDLRVALPAFAITGIAFD